MERLTAWTSDWAHFVSAVAEDFGIGLSAAEVSAKYCDQAVEWTGRVSRVRLDDEPAVKLRMPPIRVEIPDGRHGVVDYLNLVVDKNDVEPWRGVTSEMTIRFRTSIRKGAGPFPGLAWADLGDGKGYVSIGTQESHLLEIVDES